MTRSQRRDAGWPCVLGLLVLTALAVSPRSGYGQTIREQLEYMAGMRAGFEEISDDWQTWLELWSDSAEVTVRQWGARVAVGYTAEEEVIAIYRARADNFRSLADDPSANAICGSQALTGERPDMSKIDLGPLMAVTGRGFARRHLGQEGWTPPVDLAEDVEAWAAFGDYFRAAGLGEAVEILVESSQGLAVSNPRMCRMQADLYGRAASHPDDLVGTTRLIDFVRALDFLAASSS